MPHLHFKKLALLCVLAGLSLTLWGGLGAPVHAARVGRLLESVASIHERYKWPVPAPPVVSRSRQGGMKLTLLVTADTHFGWAVKKAAGAGRVAPERPQSIGQQNLRAVQHMNAIAGRRYPRILGGRVGRPQAVLVAGDLTEDGKPSEWRRFARYYGSNGRDGLLRIPVYAGIGNHDFNYGDYVVRQLTERHGGLFYSWQMQDLHLVCLGEAPGSKELSWLREDLARTGRELPVLIFLHYPLDGPFADSNWFGAGEYRDDLAEVLDGFNVVAIFHGHFHASGHYRWRGYDVYNVGSPKHLHQSFAVVRITDQALRVSSWNYQYARWWWWHQKPINGARRVRELRQIDPLPDGTRPAMMPRHGCASADSCPPAPGVLGRLP